MASRTILLHTKYIVDNMCLCRPHFVSVSTTFCVCIDHLLCLYRPPFVSVSTTFCVCIDHLLCLYRPPFVSVSTTFCPCLHQLPAHLSLPLHTHDILLKIRLIKSEAESLRSHKCYFSHSQLYITAHNMLSWEHNKFSLFPSLYYTSKVLLKAGWSLIHISWSGLCINWIMDNSTCGTCPYSIAN